MKAIGIYEVTGTRTYRGHEPGTRFPGPVDKITYARAVQRGFITLLELVGADLPAGKYQLPKDWS